MVRAGEGETRIFIRPGYQFRVVDRLVTNFHLPRSTLIMLVAAFAGYDLTMRAYRAAVAQANPVGAQVTNHFACNPAALVLRDDREACRHGLRGAMYFVQTVQF